jgi:DNA-3-methyladenine glycosylase
MAKQLPRSFFDRPTRTVAQDLLGKYIVREKEGERIALMVTETEAYDGPHDRASHASKGRTARTEPMFGPAGIWYVYLCYGVHWMLNVVTGPADYPAAVLIRGTSEVVGPGRLTRHLAIDKQFDGRTAARRTGLWFEDRSVVVPRRTIATTPRIGVAYAGAWADKPWRYTFDVGRIR